MTMNDKKTSENDRRQERDKKQENKKMCKKIAKDYHFVLWVGVTIIDCKSYRTVTWSIYEAGK